MRLRDDPRLLRIAVREVAAQTGIPEGQVEKDYWLTEALRRMAAVADEERFTLLFKGGTSLSKAFRLIERFSEDVDVLVVLPAGSKGAQDRLLRRLIDEAAAGCEVPAVVVADGTTKAVKRSARLDYPAQTPDAGTSKGLLIELGSRGGTMPHQRLTVRSLISEYGDRGLDDVDEMRPFDVSVLSPTRTLVEKLVLLHTAHADGDNARIEKTARHYYDVLQLLGQPAIVADLSVLGVDALARDVVTYSTVAELPASVRPVGGFAESPAFDPGSPSVRLARAMYQRVVDLFMWPGVQRPEFDECLDRIRTHAADL